MTNLEKAIKELLSGKKFKYKNCVLSYSKDEYIPFLSEKLEPDTFGARICAISNEEFNDFDKWEEYEEDKSIDLLIKSIEEGSGAWCWVGYRYNNLPFMVFINGYVKESKIFLDQDLNEWKYVKPVTEKDLENLKEELLC